jgi:D-alanyl-D-alanine carboxypeptidase (penicillin-binding protein 5/6)
MFLKRIATVLVLAAASVSLSLEAAQSLPPYKGAIATDALTGAVLFENNADAISPPASMTKLMTYAVLGDAVRAGEVSLSTPVTVTPEAARVGAQRDSTVVWLRTGETFTIEELTYAIMIQSANDAAYAIAQKVGGTVPAFVARMNAKARELGMTRSTFRSPNGFPPPSHRIAEGDLTTPRDFAVLCRYLLLHTDILKYTSVRTRPFGAGIRAEPVLMTNHNHLLGRYGVDGLKTGFTNGAGFCLSTTAERNGHRIIVVMMDSPDHKTRDLNVLKLINDAFVQVPVSEAPFTRGAGAPQAVPAQRSIPVAPTRPSAAAAEQPAEGPVIHLPGSSGQ